MTYGKNQNGNVLFIILIAVVLFAALSYAVSQSGRTSGGDASRETATVNSSQITQYPAAIKTALTKMIVANSISADDLLFDPPPFTALTTSVLQSQGVFYPGNAAGGGGGAPYVFAPSTVMASGTPGTWHFNGENQIKNIGLYAGTTTTSNADVIAFLPGVTLAVCQSVHQRLGLSTSIPTLTGIDITTDMTVATPHIGAGGGIITAAVLDGQPQGCFYQAPDYVYYHVLVER